MRKIKILILEDDQDWLKTLHQMYINIFDEMNLKHEIHSQNIASEAIPLLKPGAFDLLSLDINLGTSDHGITYANGFDVLTIAYEKEACNGVVIITGIQTDKEFGLVLRDKVNAQKIRATLPTHLEKLFPQRNLYFDKPSFAETTHSKKEAIVESINSYRPTLEENILRVCEKQEYKIWNKIIPRTIKKVSLLGFMPFADPWGETSKFEEFMFVMMRDITYETRINYDLNNDELRNILARKIIDSSSFSSLQWIGASSKVIGGIMGGIIGGVVHLSNWEIILSTLLGVIIGSIPTIILYVYLVIEISIKTLSYLIEKH